MTETYTASPEVMTIATALSGGIATVLKKEEGTMYENLEAMLACNALMARTIGMHKVSDELLEMAEATALVGTIHRG